MSNETKTFDPNHRQPIEGAKNRTDAHLWLQQMVGEWKCKTEMMMPDGTSFTVEGTESVRKLGEYWIVAEVKSPMPDDGTEGTMLITVGYDINKGRFVGSWVGSMMENLWVYDGFMDEDGHSLILESTGPGMMDESKVETYRDIMTIDENGGRTMTSNAKDESGNWTPFMTVRYEKVS